MRYSTEEQKAIAHTIISQLGGGRLKAMVGAKNFVVQENDNGEVSLGFRIGRNSNGVNFVKITLNNLDLYNTEYSRIHGLTYTVKSSSKNIYNDMLVADFEKATGMYLTFI